jgi:ATP-dependent Lhr-like helicase
VLSAFEDSGRCRRGYFVASLGAAQFGAPGAVDRLRSYSSEAVGEAGAEATAGSHSAMALAATDPANPYGAALPWPDRVVEDPVAAVSDGGAPARSAGADGSGRGSSGHRPGRKAGALVVMVDGELAVYVERGGRTLLTFTGDPDALGPAVAALASAVRQGALGRLTVERADGEHILGPGGRPTALRQALESAGFVATPRGLRLRA